MIHVGNTASDACTECAKSLINILQETIRERGTAYVAISGGSTPKLLFDIICASFSKDVDWSNVHLFWVDERCVLPSHEESNYRMTKEHLLKFLPFDDKKIHRIKGECEPALEVLRYAKEIAEIVPAKNGFPVFDVILLGMGDDGHTASIFPNALHLLESPNITATAVQPQSGQMRITLTGRVINNAEHVMFLATGANKANVLDIILHNKPNAKLYPATHIVPASNNLDWYIDQEAGNI